MLKQTHIKNEKCRMNYLLYYPENYADKPLIIFLHGAGERGDAYDHLSRHGLPRLLEEGREYDSVILCPQCPAHLVWDNMVEELKELIDNVVAEFGIKKDRIAITGGSMGGYGTWSMVLTYPSFFSAAAPVAGGGMAWRTPKLITTPIYAYHGASDSAVLPVYSQLMVDGTNNFGGKAELTLLQGMEHNEGINYAYSDTDLMDKLISARRTNFERVPEICEDLF